MSFVGDDGIRLKNNRHEHRMENQPTTCCCVIARPDKDDPDPDDGDSLSAWHINQSPHDMIMDQHASRPQNIARS